MLACLADVGPDMRRADITAHPSMMAIATALPPLSLRARPCRTWPCHLGHPKEPVIGLLQAGEQCPDLGQSQAVGHPVDDHGRLAGRDLLQLHQGRTADAVKLYAEVASSSDAPPALRDLASIREMSASFDTRKPDEVIARLEPLAVPGNAWFGSAGELVAMAYLEKGETARAGTLFGEISRAEDVPETLRTRARQMAGLLGVDAIEDPDSFIEDQRLPGANAAEAR